MPSATADLTPLQFAALAIYAERPRHPYEVFQEMQRRRGDRLVKVRPGTLYHAVNRLAELSLLEAAGTGREGNRPARTTYAITEQGRRAVVAHVAQMVSRRAEEFPEFPLGVAELRHLEPGESAELLARRAAALREELDSLTAAEPHLRDSSLPEVLWVEHGWLTAMTRTDLAWTKDLIARLRTGGLAWNPAQLAEEHGGRQGPWPASLRPASL
jgi:DNA-binding PadR family transcriptional regulator